MKEKVIRKNKEISNSIIKGLNESLDFAKGNKTKNLRTREITIPEIPQYKGKDIKVIRKKLNISQRLFANTLGVSVKTVEAWESNRNIPNGPAQRILYALNRNTNILKLFNIQI